MSNFVLGIVWIFTALLESILKVLVRCDLVSFLVFELQAEVTHNPEEVR